ncbi:hypothetical protein ABS241_20850, partial [Acinetobacter baumannii]
DLTLGDIRTRYAGHNIIIATNAFGAQPAIWSNIPHYWVGKDIPSEQELDIYIDKNTVETYKSKLWSLQVVRYKKLYG